MRPYRTHIRISKEQGQRDGLACLPVIAAAEIMADSGSVEIAGTLKRTTARN